MTDNRQGEDSDPGRQLTQNHTPPRHRVCPEAGGLVGTAWGQVKGGLTRQETHVGLGEP